MVVPLKVPEVNRVFPVWFCFSTSKTQWEEIEDFDSVEKKYIKYCVSGSPSRFFIGENEINFKEMKIYKINNGNYLIQSISPFEKRISFTLKDVLSIFDNLITFVSQIILEFSSHLDYEKENDSKESSLTTFENTICALQSLQEKYNSFYQINNLEEKNSLLEGIINPNTLFGGEKIIFFFFFIFLLIFFFFFF